MCYNIAGLAYRKLKEAIRGDASPEEIEELEQIYEHLKTIYHEGETQYFKSGFSFPFVTVFLEIDGRLTVDFLRWGMVPFYTKGSMEAQKIRSMTLNARGETIFERASFKGPAKYRRCIVVLDGFYEYFHYKGKKYPFFISLKDDKPITLGGLWDEWTDRDTGELHRTVSIVTTEGNELMKKIHNNPKAKGPRMPLIIPPEKHEEWIQTKFQSKEDIDRIKQMILPFDESQMEYFPVAQLIGKIGVGNTADAREAVDYEVLRDLEWVYRV